MSENNNDQNQEGQPKENYKKLELKPGSHVLGHPEITPEKWAEMQASGQTTTTETPYAKLGDSNNKKKSDDDDDREGAIALAISQGLNSTALDPETLEAQRISRKRMRELAGHEIAYIPLFKNPISKGKWVNPYTNEEEEDYEKGPESWTKGEYKRYPISKKDWDFVEGRRLKSAKEFKNDGEKLRDEDEKYTLFLAKKFFDMDAEDVQIADTAVLKDYIASSIYRTVVGLPNSAQESKSSLRANTPIR